MSKRKWKPGWVMAVIILVISAAAAGVFFIYQQHPMDYRMYSSSAIQYEKGVVTKVISEQTQLDETTGLQLGLQILEVEMRSGDYQGQKVAIENNLSTTHNVPVSAGQSIVVKVDQPENTSPYFTVYNYDRTNGILIAAGIFVALMVLVGKFKGIRSVLGLFFSLFFVVFLLIPMIYHGVSPVISALVTALTVAAACMCLLNGVSKKTLVSLLAIGIGTLVSVGIYYLLAWLLRISGFQLGEAEELLLIAQNTGLKIGDLLFAGVLIASLGALMDMTMSIASALFEIRELHPEMPFMKVFRSGMNISRDMIGTMCETLVLAFVGTALPNLLVLSSYGVHFDQLLSSDYLAVEILYAITGGISVVLCVPATVGLCALLFSGTRKRAEKRFLPKTKAKGTNEKSIKN